MIAPLALLALATGAFAQQDTDFVTGLVNVLTEQNLTSLLEVAIQANSTPTGAAFFAALEQSALVFAPSNEAFAAVPANLSAQTLADILSYHVLPGNYSGISPADGGSVIGATLLNDSSLVQLEGNKSQVVVWSLRDDEVVIENQSTNVTVQGTVTYRNLIINVIDGVLAIPGNFSEVAEQNNFTRAEPLFAELVEDLSGFTVFAASNAAINSINESFAALAAGDPNELQAILGNHYIPGTTAYSTELTDGQVLTTASGGSLTVSINDTGVFVTGGPSTVQVTKADVLVENGVVHIIDGLFLYADTNPEAASSAIAAASSAGASPTSGGPIGGAPSPSATEAPASSAMLSASFKSASVLVAVACVALAF